MTVRNALDVHPLDVEKVRERIDVALTTFLDDQDARLADLMPGPANSSRRAQAMTSLREFLAGGKRLRPAFCYWGWRGAGGGPDGDEITAAAAALELLHAFALIHDDIMDGSDLRRGAPALHRRHAAVHAEHGWRGTSDAFGVGVAILLGDLCLGWFHELMDGSGLPADRLRAARPLLFDGYVELIAGQYLDLCEQTRARSSVERARTVIRYKTAKYTIERPLHLGGRLAGAGADLMAAYSAYALPLGEAFQLRDDLLGAFGDPAVTGKPVGDDLRSGKATVLMAMTHERAGRGPAAELRRLLDLPDVNDAAVERMQSIILESGAATAVEDLIRRQAEAAARVVDTMAVADEVRTVLGELVVAATDRRY
jgi:geranylgeranyl diphosphate synthase, type I